MKVLRMIARLNVGGPARHVVWLTSSLRDEEFSSELIAGSVPAGEEDMSYFAEANGVTPVYIEQMSRELSLGDITSFFKVLGQIRKIRPDIIHTHTAKAGTVGRAAAFCYRWFTWKTLIGRPRRVKIAHTFHGHVFHSYYGKVKTKLFIFIEKALAALATDKIVVITQQQFDEIHERFGIGKRKQFTVIPLGIDLSRSASLAAEGDRFRNEIHAAPNEIVVVFVGRLTEIKNIPLLLSAAQEYAELPEAPAARFAVVGDGHLRPDLEKIAIASGISDRVVFTGNREDVEDVFAGADIAALTSLNEGTPLSIIEAMASGKPVISTAVGGVKDLLGKIERNEDGFDICERGVSVPSGSSSGFAKGLLYLAKNERLRFDLGAAGREFVMKNYSKERLISDIKDLYREMKEE